ncbi:MAG TPA: chemotaxis protein CheB [Bryobacteraceae bacterium]|nr:chemotaxis protein CheB [Bryobacteraceae bacterium]
MPYKKKGKNGAAGQAVSAEATGETPRKHGEGESEETGQSCPVVGFGASAGGLEAMTEVLREMPDDTGLAIVFIQHLDPKHSSMLSELLARATTMPVQQAANGMKVEPNKVYVIAPNTCIALRRGALFNEPRDPSAPHMPIDYFFRSLADDQGSKAIGVVLSGTASDGTLGLKAIKEAGGIALAQDPESAKYDGMPRSAIVAGCVDTTLTTKGIAAELVRLCHHPYISRRPVEEAPEHEKAFEEIMNMLRAAKGVDFSHYKPGTVRRRTLRRMAIHRLETPDKYAKYLRGNRDEVDLLFNDILIHVTSFFREAATFTAITTHVLPAILKNRSQDDPVRVWVPGCATGEEAYSVAICILEYMRQTGIETAVQLFGTDLSDVALEQARAGIYPVSIEADVSPERLRRFFVPTNGMYQIARSVRDMCIFARQNVTKDPPFSKLDLITCRNVLIYLGHTLQSKVMRLFHYALKPTGYLVLGASETVGNATELFLPVDRQHKIYSRKPTPSIITNDFSGYEEPHADEAAKQRPQAPRPRDDDNQVDQLLLVNFTPAAVVVDTDLRILQFRGDTSSYLRHPSGSASLSVIKLARGTLAAEIRKLMSVPEEKNGPVKSKPIALVADGVDKRVMISVLPIEHAPEPQFLVVFEDLPPEAPRTTAKGAPAGKSGGMADRVKELEDELSSTKRYLHSVIEEQEAATEELKSAHEEVQSSNEELQSTNEELLTAKEELQSTNEELTTVNDEMQSRNSELQQINNDLTNLLSSVNIPIVMLGNDLHIRRFTPHAEKILNLLPSDVGRPVSDFRLKIAIPDLVQLCQEVIDSLVPREREVQDPEGRLYSMWVRPYRTADNRIDGVVLALFDVTERKQAAEARYRRLFEAAKDGVVIADAATGEILDVNPFISKLSGYPRSSLVGVKFWESDLFGGTEITEAMAEELRKRESLQKSLALTTDAGQAVAVDITASLYTEGDRHVIQFNIRDVSTRKRLEEQIYRNQEELRETEKMEAVGRLAGGVAHEFNNILTTVVGYSGLLKTHLDSDEPGLRMTDEIHTAAERAIAVTKQLLAFGRKQIMAPAVIDVNEAIGDLRQMASVMMTRGVEFEVDLAGTPARVRADRGQIEQVVLNLVLNARDAMPEGGTVKVSTANADTDQAFAEKHPTVPAGRYVTITVQDTGSGMDEETKAHIFEPFFTTKPKGAGAGLGLATVYGIVKQSGGYVSATSELGVGTTFTVYLPRVEAPETVAEIPGGGGAIDGTETILLVEDERAVRELERRFLEMRGYKVLEASDGREALRISRTHQEPIHLLITDVVMPKMSGREVALQLASERPDMKVLYMSGHTEEAIVDHGVLQEGMEFLQKPFQQEDLMRRVRKILDADKVRPSQ